MSPHLFSVANQPTDYTCINILPGSPLFVFLYPQTALLLIKPDCRGSAPIPTIAKHSTLLCYQSQTNRCESVPPTESHPPPAQVMDWPGLGVRVYIQHTVTAISLLNNHKPFDLRPLLLPWHRFLRVPCLLISAQCSLDHSLLHLLLVH